MRITDFDINVLIENLQGTCSSIEDHLPEGMDWNDLTTEDHEAIDNEIFLCAECGWWYEVCESNDRDGENVCDDCNEN